MMTCYVKPALLTVSASISVPLCFRKPRVSSSELDRKMADRRLIRLSQVPERLTREKLEDCDWVTFAVLISKATPQSNSSVSVSSPAQNVGFSVCYDVKQL